ncbi:hypothetical protein M8J76_016965 [Diaphorina citri]|nr:hypothetical protein M8J75_004800 [Diaphorina citri]KAI5724203.1 hypothetical protein M8J76_016965 [Diaphorina citri]
MTSVGGSIDLLFIGTGAGGASKLRGSTSMAIRLQDGEVWMFDCGEGTGLRLNEVYVKPSKISAIFITHLHGDHAWGLPGVLCSHWNCNDTIQKRGKTGFHIFGPRGIRKLLRTQLLLSRSMCMFQFTVHEMIPLDCQYDNKEEADYYKNIETADGHMHPQEILGQDIKAHIGPDGHPRWHLVNDSRGSIIAGKIQHRLPTFGFTFVESSPIPNINTYLLRNKYNLTPGVEYGMLQRGIAVHLPNNITIHPSEVLMNKIRGRKITILGDTSNPWPMVGIARGSDVLVHEATHLKHQKEAAEFYGHSTPTMAVRFAKAINARLLILSHISQRVVSRPGVGGRGLNKTTFTTDDVMNEAIDELFRYRYRNLSMIIAEDGTVLRLEKKHNYSARSRPWYYLTRLKKTLSVHRTVFESIPNIYQRPPSNYNHKFKQNTFLPPLNMLTNFSRHKFLKYYNQTDLKLVQLNSNPNGGPGVAVWTKRPFYKSIPVWPRVMKPDLLNIQDNRTFVKLESQYMKDRQSKSEQYFNRTVSKHYFSKYGDNGTVLGEHPMTDLKVAPTAQANLTGLTGGL